MARWKATQVHAQPPDSHLLSADFYERWKKEVGATAWGLLEREVGRIGQ
jgi:hypothetical protein